MVPSVGLFTARYAALAASSNASASSRGVSSDLSWTALAKPRKICERITPELPRAPIRLSWAAIRAILLTSLACESRTCSTADCSVSSMLVPVSPSGTGNTLSRLTSSWCAPSHARLPSNACFRSWPFTLPPPVLSALVVIPVDPLHEDVHLRDRDPGRTLDLEADSTLQVVRHFRDPDTVLDDDVQVDRQHLVHLPHLHSTVNVFAAQQSRDAVAQTPGCHAHDPVALDRGVSSNGTDHARKYLDSSSGTSRAQGAGGCLQGHEQGLWYNPAPFFNRSVLTWQRDVKSAGKPRNMAIMSAIPRSARTADSCPTCRWEMCG